MFKTNINIESIGLNKIVFTINPNVNYLMKSQLSFKVNNSIFDDYDIKNESDGSIIYYEIIPYKPFSINDIIDFQIIDTNYLSNMVKILICKNFEDGKTDVNFKLNGDYNGECVFIIKKVTGYPCYITSNPIVISKPIDSDKSYIWTENYYDKLGEILDVYVKLITIDNKPVPDGLYEIEILNNRK